MLSLPAASTALTRKVWLPSASCWYVVGLVQLVKPPESSRQRKVAVESSSVKANVALVDADALGGAEVMVGAGGGVTSIVQLYVVVVLSLPTASTALTLKVCAPSESWS